MCLYGALESFIVLRRHRNHRCIIIIIIIIIIKECGADKVKQEYDHSHNSLAQNAMEPIEDPNWPITSVT